MPIRTRPFNFANYLDSDEVIAAYITQALESNDPAEIADAMGTVARARGMGKIARAAGVSRESLYRGLSKKGNPELNTLLRVMGALNLRLSATPRAPSPTGLRTKRRATLRKPVMAAG